MPNQRLPETVQRRIAISQLARNHPILTEPPRIQRQYLGALQLYCKKLLRFSAYERAVLQYYRAFFHAEHVMNSKRTLSERLRVILLFDIVHISGYNRNTARKMPVRKFQFSQALSDILVQLFADFRADDPMWEALMQNPCVSADAEWLEAVRRNAAFSRQKPYRILVTATMSAGKSTFINALIGQKIARTSNLACTGRLHYIYSKPTDDQLIGLWDREILLDAGSRIARGGELHTDRKSYESVYYGGGLGGMQCVLLDTPGVNAAEHPKHALCTQNAVRSAAYDALIFVINYENFGTVDEQAHLDFIRQNVSSSIPILFCLNKIDAKKQEDAPIGQTVQKIEAYLQELGFPDAAVFPVSARAAFLDRTRSTLTDANELDELALLTGRFQRSKNRVQPRDQQAKKDGFAYCCGIGYIEDHLKHLMLQSRKDGKNDRGLHSLQSLPTDNRHDHQRESNR